MPRRLSAREVERALERIGFLYVRQRGSHRRMRGEFRGQLRNVSLVAGEREIPSGTLLSICRQAGLTAMELEHLVDTGKLPDDTMR